MTRPIGDLWLNGRSSKHLQDMAIIFALALILRTSLFLVSLRQIGITGLLAVSPDTTVYMNMARSIIGGNGGCELSFFVFGPGFAAYLGALLFIFEPNTFPLFVINLLLSALACVVIHQIAQELLESRAASVTAGVLAAISYNSITLSCVLLSDTAFLFLFAVAVLHLVRALKSRRAAHFVLAGLAFALATLVRPIGQFYPFAMLAFGAGWLLLRGGASAGNRRRTYLLLFLCFALSVSLPAVWMVRNKAVHDVATLSFASAGGPANVAALAEESLTGTPYREVRQAWVDSALAEQGKTSFTLDEEYGVLRQKTREVMRNQPLGFVRAYLALAWENLNEISYLHRALLPDYQSTTIPMEYWFIGHYLNYVGFALSMLGLAVLLLTGRYRAALALGLTYLYFAMLIGFTRWQGARLFLPGLIPETALIAAAVAWAANRLDRLLCIRSVVNPFLRRLVTGNDPDGNALLALDPERWRRFWPVFAGLMIAALVLVFWRFIFSGKMLVANDIFAAGIFFRDFLREHLLEHGGIPMWNPYFLCGLPFVDAIHGGVFYPLQWIDLISHSVRLIGFNLILHFLLAGVLAYAAARQMQLQRVASAVTGFAYGLSPCLISWVVPGHDGKIYVAALLPLVVLLLDRLWRRMRMIDAAWLGVALGGTILTGHLQMAYYVFVATGFISLWRLVSRWRKEQSWRCLARPVLLSAAALVLALGISAVQALPSFEYLTEYSSRASRLRGLEFAGAFSLHSEELVLLAVPEFCGYNNCETGEKRYWGKNSFKDNSEAIGIIPLMLAVLALALPTAQKKQMWAWLGGLSLLFAMGTSGPFFGLMVSLLPWADSMRAPSTVMFVACFSAAVLSGIAVDTLSRVEPASTSTGRDRSRARALLWAAPALLFFAFLQFCLCGQSLLRHYCAVMHPAILPSGEAADKWAYAVANLPAIRVGFLAAAAYSAVIVWIVTRVWLVEKPQRRWLLLLPPMVALSLGLFASPFVQITDRHRDFENNAISEYLALHAGEYRVVGFAFDITRFRSPYHRVQTTVGVSSRSLDRYVELIGGVQNRDFFFPRFMNLTGTRYIVYPARGALPPDTMGPIPFDTLMAANGCMVFRNDNCLPRAFLVDHYHVDTSEYLLEQHTKYFKGDLRRIVYLEEEPQLKPVPDTLRSGNAEINFYSPDSIRIEVHTDTDQMLILTDNWYPYYRAWVDGVERRVYRANRTFRAVEVPAGSTEVVFRYDSPVYRAGRTITLLSLAVALAVLGQPLWRRLLQARGKRPK